MTTPHHLFVNVDPYVRVSRCSARALAGDDPAAAAAQAKAISVERGTYVIARRAEELTAAISSSAGD